MGGLYYCCTVFWYIGVCMFVCVLCVHACVLVGFYSCCLYKYDITLYTAHSMISLITYSNYFIHESVISIAHGVLYINERYCPLFTVVTCAVECQKPAEAMEGF